jgi:isopenicillin N synthase-like dioxygenase
MNGRGLGARASFDQIPVVDVGGLFSPILEERRAVARDLDGAARSAGFLYVENHRIPNPLLSRLRGAAAAFFAQSEEVKLRYYIGLSRNHRGYVPPGEEVFYGQSKDRKEAFDLALDLPPDDPDYLAGNRLLGPNVWPREVPVFEADVSAYYQAALDLGRRLLRGFALALGLAEDHFDGQVKKPPSQLRLIHYPPDQDAQSQSTGIGAHTDYECFTILHTTAPGLEVCNPEGRWIDAPPIEGAFVVNIGDLFEVLTNGAWVSTTHRVRKVVEERYSFPLFFNLDYPTLVEPLGTYLEPGQKTRYESVIAGEHLLAQTMQSFTYLKRELEEGKARLPDRTLGLASFGREARVEQPASAAEQAGGDGASDP